LAPVLGLMAAIVEAQLKLSDMLLKRLLSDVPMLPSVLARELSVMVTLLEWEIVP
jgi:hypothetical protein